MSSTERPAINVSPSQAGSKLLSKFSDAESLIVRSTSPSNPSDPEVRSANASIPLVRSQELEQSIRQSPANSEPYVELGQFYLGQQRWTDAKRVLDAGVQNCAECEPLVLMREDLILMLAGQQVESARTAFAQHPVEQNKYDLDQAEVNLCNERLRICRDRYSRHPDQREILITWSVALRQMGRHDEALQKLTEAAADPKLRARACLQLGMCLQTLNRPLEALSAFRKAALYRSPPPDLAIKARALELAVQLAEENQLIDSARYYARELLECCDSKSKPAIRATLARLEATEL
jgi:tetratricopeptide (TPR) repeat protein